MFSILRRCEALRRCNVVRAARALSQEGTAGAPNLVLDGVMDASIGPHRQGFSLTKRRLELALADDAEKVLGHPAAVNVAPALGPLGVLQDKRRVYLRCNAVCTGKKL
jgi:hypothetical protein